MRKYAFNGVHCFQMEINAMTPINVKEVAQAYGVHVSTVYRWEEQKIIPTSRKWGSTRRWFKEEIDAHKRGDLSLLQN